MSDETKKVEETEQDAKAAELSEADLEQVAGGAATLKGTIKNDFLKISD